MNLRVVSRAIIYNKDSKKILLARNKGADFWYAPGGGWEHDQENIQEAVIREVKEECGLDVATQRLLYAQEFHPTDDEIFLELFWLCHVNKNQISQNNHTDTDPEGEVDEVRWFNQVELQDLKIFPKRLKHSFWKNIQHIMKIEDSFIGVT